ncbi:prenylated RAB acceptor 1.H [Striga asiatica]|uniref:PRA1 family protein n=1 Tax=Striga asiatica TaxID=4170 RepID=A0A5A7R801_STRAF|nr:prenylated RAB acceptor 1.H [Striga asiatica]
MVIKSGGSPANRRRKEMVFDPNPLSLSVPEPAFESWLRDSGYLEVLDQRTTDLHRLSSAGTTESAAAIGSDGVHLASQLLSRIWTLLSLLTFSPFSKLAASDFTGTMPSWTAALFGSYESYSFPSSPSQARLRVHENVKRFAQNYAVLFALFFACALYQLPLALVGLILCFALWDAFKLSSNRWGFDRYPVIRQSLVRIAQCATAVILFTSNIQLAVFCAFVVSYAAMILHASFRKLTPTNQPAAGGGCRKVAGK